MLKYFNNFSTSPRLSLEAKYYGPSGKKSPAGTYPDRKVYFEGTGAICNVSNILDQLLA